MEKLTPAQEKWLMVLRHEGFVAMGGWGNGQKNRPLFRLCELGFAEFGWGPKGDFLQCQGFSYVEAR